MHFVQPQSHSLASSGPSNPSRNLPHPRATSLTPLPAEPTSAPTLAFPLSRDETRRNWRRTKQKKVGSSRQCSNQQWSAVERRQLELGSGGRNPNHHSEARHSQLSCRGAPFLRPPVWRPSPCPMHPHPRYCPLLIFHPLVSSVSHSYVRPAQPVHARYVGGVSTVSMSCVWLYTRQQNIYMYRYIYEK